MEARRGLTLRLLSIGIALLLGCQTRGLAAGQSNPWVGLDITRQQQLRTLMARIRNTPPESIQQRQEFIEKALELGEKPAAREILLLLDAEERLPWKNYRDAFESAAALLRQRRPIPKENRRKQEAALARALHVAGEKESLEVAWTAMQELKAMCCFTPAEVQAASSNLRPGRERLLSGEALRTRCREVLGESGDVAAGVAQRLDVVETSVAARGFARGSDLAVMKANEPLLTDLDPEEARAIVDLNVMRVLMGRSALAVDVKLCAAARGHSGDMREKGFFDHVSPVPGKRAFTDRARLAGTSARAENIFMGSETGASANNGWFHSPGHFVNMFNPVFKRVGLGRAGTHWTEMFW